MRGLIEKDFLLLLKQKRLAVIYLFVAIMLSFSMDPIFIVSYFSMIGALLVLTSISYDSNDNGYAFLMSLPVNAKSYVYEKYVFSILNLAFFWACSVLLQYVSFLIRKLPFQLTDTLLSDLTIFPLFLLVIALLLPINLKFGTDKGRIVLLVICGIAVLIGISGKKLLEILVKGHLVNMDDALLKLQSIPQDIAVFVGHVVIVGFLVSLVILLISMAISLKIMQNKEF